MNHVAAFCIALSAVSFIIVTAAGSILLAAIPPQHPQSSVSANTHREAIRIPMMLTLNPHFSLVFTARRRKRMWMESVRPGTLEAARGFVSGAFS